MHSATNQCRINALTHSTTAATKSRTNLYAFSIEIIAKLRHQGISECISKNVSICSSRPTWGIRHAVKLRSLPQDTSLRERVDMLDIADMMTSPTQ
jgi:hypothetical protein